MNSLTLNCINYTTWRPLPGASVTAYQSGTTTRASIYNAGDAPLSNPFSADSNGIATFDAPNGTYDVVYSLGGYVSPTLTFQIVDNVVVAETLISGLFVETASNQTISGVKTFTSAPIMPDPTSDQNAVTRGYLKTNTPSLFVAVNPVNAATTGALPANVYANGSAGVGATLTGAANGALPAQDGLTLAVGQSILVKNEAAGANNGLYTVTALGSSMAPYVLTRRTDTNTAAGLARILFTVLGGTLLGGSSYALSLAAPAITVGTTALNFTLVSTATSGVAAEAVARAAGDAAIGMLIRAESDGYLSGVSQGSPLPSDLTLVERSPKHYVLGGIAPDGSDFKAKYDPYVKSAATFAAPSDGLIVQEGNDIVRYNGQARVVILNGDATMQAVQDRGTVISFTSSKYLGARAGYTVARDGTRILLVRRNAAWLLFLCGGQSNELSQDSAAGITATPPYPNNLLMLYNADVYRQPVRFPGSALSAHAVLGPAYEGGHETPATQMGAGFLVRDLPVHPGTQLVVGGYAVSGQLIANLTKGGSTGAYEAQIAYLNRVVALLGAGGYVPFAQFDQGEADYASTTYEADLDAYIADFNTDVPAITGQGEPVVLLMTQLGSLRYSAPTAPLTYLSVLAQLSAAMNNPTRIAVAFPAYILPFLAESDGSGNLHYTARGNWLNGQYLGKAASYILTTGRTWTGVRPRPLAEWTFSGNYFDVPFDTQGFALTLDTLLAAAGSDCPNFGFNFTEAGGHTLTSVTLTPNTTNSVRFTGTWTNGLAGLTSPARLSYAYENGTAKMSGPTAGARGMLRNIDPALAADGVTPMPDPCQVFSQQIK